MHGSRGMQPEGEVLPTQMYANECESWSASQSELSLWCTDMDTGPAVDLERRHGRQQGVQKGCLWWLLSPYFLDVRNSSPLLLRSYKYRDMPLSPSTRHYRTKTEEVLAMAL